MTPTATATPTAAPADRTVCCTLAARAALLISAEEVPALRRAVSPLTGEPLPPAFLKHSDEQTVAAVAAVFRAVADAGLDANGLGDWAVLAAPRFLGRGAMGAVLHRFRDEGAWGISPHLIPHRSLHSVAGTVSLALKSNGPNLGVGGGPGTESEVFAVAAGLLRAGDLPGVWVVLTGYEPELIPVDPAGPTGEMAISPPSTVAAVAFALVPGRAAEGCWEVRVAAGERARAPLLTLERLRCVAAAGASGRWALAGGGILELRTARAETGSCL